MAALAVQASAVGEIEGDIQAAKANRCYARLNGELAKAQEVDTILKRLLAVNAKIDGMDLSKVLPRHRLDIIKKSTIHLRFRLGI